MHGDGDPLTPLYPSKKELFKSRTIEQAKRDGALPSIPVLPVSYSTAYQILSRMKGRPAPQPWQGAINVTYKVGPGFQSDETLTISVNGNLKIKKIRNVVGYIRGKDEPDRYVILGNHYDAWVYGSMDPNSGTAILAEVARAMMQAVNESGWRPARTIMFAAWDGEEHGIIGSTEFVEEFTDILRQRAIVYLNMDCLHGNTSLHVGTTPSLYRITMDAARKIENPSKSEKAKGRETMYDSWVKTFPSGTPGLPNIPVPGGGSDHAAFLTYAGVPVVDFTYKNATTRDTYPLYHTMYETPFLNEHLLDTDNFAVHRAVGQYWAELARYFTDEAVLPFNTTELANVILKGYALEKCQKSCFGWLWSPNLIEGRLSENITIPPSMYSYCRSSGISPNESQIRDDHVLHAIGIFAESVRPPAYFSRERETDEVNPTAICIHNPQQQLIPSYSAQRCFINPRGMATAPQSRHVLYSISEHDSYSSRQMAAVYDAVGFWWLGSVTSGDGPIPSFQVDAFANADSDQQRVVLGMEIANQMSIVQHSIHCATSTLKDVI
ncbi:peptidase, M28 family [Ancylostoma ceylanicum]|uniref:Peptidase, M28 family n=1 Tax=Ancylostoma ceylanicum TaxID=53326 RepID=A0A0D6LFB9_9BILA|nr:peptidase, M28 family [Ancylostoma ceylanicum]